MAVNEILWIREDWITTCGMDTLIEAAAASTMMLVVMM